MKTATEISKWFIINRSELKNPSLEGSIKLQKLLFFAWLIHFRRHGEALFDDDFFAFAKGPVVETVRKNYNTDFSKFLIPSNSKYTNEEIDSLMLCNEIFGDSTAEELVDLSHNSPAWSKYFTQSLQGSSCDGFKSKDLSKIKKSDFDEEFDMIDTVLYVHENMLSVECR
ncbi:MAG: SocA family protein [Methanosarcinales archaeon]|jgi:uncharacterized phage-associated protein|nr:SocA family protein [Methanosarcinales archaeon]